MCATPMQYAQDMSYSVIIACRQCILSFLLREFACKHTQHCVCLNMRFLEISVYHAPSTPHCLWVQCAQLMAFGTNAQQVLCYNFAVLVPSQLACAPNPMCPTSNFFENFRNFHLLEGVTHQVWIQTAPRHIPPYFNSRESKFNDSVL
jgi:hypothetical protein